jgi:hypothetical protein
MAQVFDQWLADTNSNRMLHKGQGAEMKMESRRGTAARPCLC